MRIREPQFSTLFATLLVFCIPMIVQSRPSRQESSLTRAKELWELAIAAKGGREKLHKVANLALYDQEGKGVDFMVFPDRYFSWGDTRPSKIGLIVEMFNFEHGIDYTIFGDNPPKIHRKLGLSPELRSRFLDPQLYYFLETRWFKPEVLGASKSRIRDKSLDLVEVFVKGYGTPFRFGVFLDEKTHLPVRIGIYSTDRKDDMFAWVDLDEYREISGIKVPTAIRSDLTGRWNSIQFEINAEYNSETFEREPDMKAGPFQWRKVGTRPAPMPLAEVVERLKPEQIQQYLKEMESADYEIALTAHDKLIKAGQQAVPALISALQTGGRELKYRAAQTLLEINKENEAAVRALREVLLDVRAKAQLRQDAAFGLMWSDQGIAALTELLEHPDTIVRRCVIFAFDEMTELTEIPRQTMEAVSVLKQLLKDKDEVVRGMAEEVLEQIESYQKRKAKK